MVYLIENDGAYKIGSSANPETRLGQVAPSGRLLHCFPSANAFQVERAIQRRFNDCLIRSMGREWFRLTQEDVDAICRLGRVDAVDDLPADLQPGRSGMSTTVRLSADLVRMARVICAHSSSCGPRLKFVGYIDSLVRDRILADYDEAIRRVTATVQSAKKQE
jgi:hypothetical protein